jgi:hypothetical protein
MMLEEEENIKIKIQHIGDATDQDNIQGGP